MKEQLIKRLFEDGWTVFDTNGSHAFARNIGNIKEEINIFDYRRGYDDKATKQINEEAVETKYRRLVDRLEREGYHVLEVDEDQTDGYKGKQFGSTLMIYKDLPTIEKIVVLGHEYLENRLMRKANKSDAELHPYVQKLEEKMLGPGGDFEFLPAYAKSIELGELAGIRKPATKSVDTVFG